jgi:hypothetical protein
VARDYRAVDNGVVFGPWVEGDVVEVDDDRAAWMNRDSPGTLVPADEEAPEDAEDTEDAEGGDVSRRPHARGRSARATATRRGTRPSAGGDGGS